MMPAAVVGSTGLVGSNILSALLAHPAVSSVCAFARRQLSEHDPSSKLRPVVDKDVARWPAELAKCEPIPSIFFSGLATTRAQAGGFESQRKIDYDLNLAMARAAKEAGVKVYVLISVGGATTSSPFAYPRMKGELEDAVENLGFEHTVFSRPGLIVGTRQETRPAEYAFQLVARFLGGISGGYLKDFWAQDADVIAKAAVNAGLKCLNGIPAERKTWRVGMGDIMRLGRVEWKPEAT